MTWRIYQSDATPVPIVAPPDLGFPVPVVVSLPIIIKGGTYYQTPASQTILVVEVDDGDIGWFSCISSPSQDTWRIYDEESTFVPETIPFVPPDSWFENFSGPVWTLPGLRKDLQRANIDCIFRVPLTILLAMNVTEQKDIAAIAIDVNPVPPPPPAGSASVVIIEIPLYNRLGGGVIIEEP